MCIIELDKLEILPAGFDSPPRQAAIEAIEKGGVKIKDCWSGWGLTQEAFEDLIHTAGISEYNKTAFADLTHFPKFPRCPAKHLYELLGAKEYRCIDLNGEHESVPHDLNLPFTDSSLCGHFDLVSDHGANEHVFNIAEAYRTTHRLCKPGGIIVIIQALYG